MRVFLTGSNGFIGSAIVTELVGAGHEVLGLVRSDAAARALEAKGAKAHRGDLDDLDSLRRGVAAADGVVHTAFVHDFSKFKENCEFDRRVIEALGTELVGSDRPFVVTSGTALVSPGQLATEDAVSAIDPNIIPRVATEQATSALLARGVRVSLVRLAPSVHGRDDDGVWKAGFASVLIATAREKGVSAYVGQGIQRWNAVHRLDAARLYRLALENAPIGAKLHAVGDEAVTVREIAEVIGRRLSLSVVSKSRDQAAAHFGWFGTLAGLDIPASSALTQARLGWKPEQPGLLDDLAHGGYFQA
jgi:nucleoside-diphosphate-sugar epimerase